MQRTIIIIYDIVLLIERITSSFVRIEMVVVVIVVVVCESVCSVFCVLFCNYV